MDRAQDRIETAVRSIMSGNNACGTLQSAVTGNGDYFRQAIAPVIQVYDDELKQAQRDQMYASRDAEFKRQALESVISNIQNLPPDVFSAIARAMPGHPLLAGNA